MDLQISQDFSDYFSQISQNLREILVSLRRQKGFTQQELADTMGVGVVTIRRYESLKLGKTLGLDFIYALARTADCHPKDIIKDIFALELEASGELRKLPDEQIDTISQFFRFSDRDTLRFFFEKQDKGTVDIKDELLEMASIYLASDRLTQLEIFLDLARKGLSDAATNGLSLAEQQKIRSFVEKKTKEWRYELSKQYTKKPGSHEPG